MLHSVSTYSVERPVIIYKDGGAGLKEFFFFGGGGRRSFGWVEGRSFPIMLLKLAFYAPRNSALRQKKCSNYAFLFNFKKNVETQVSCLYQQLNKVNSV